MPLRKKRGATEMELKEPLMNNTDPVTAGQLFLANTGPNATFRVVKSTVTGLVSDLKTALGASAIRRCDAAGRASGAFVDVGGFGGRDFLD
jgi:hypothetical protein